MDERIFRGLRAPLVTRAIGLIREREVPLAVQLWNGDGYEPKEQASVRVHVRNARALRLLADPELGRLAQAYVEQDIDLEGHPRDILAVGEHLSGAADASDKKRAAVWSQVLHTRRADRRNVQHHYDVSNDFFALWLDRRRVYSCAYFRDEHDSLESAQENKLDLVCRKLRLEPGETLLDIGCGWGGLIFWAAERYGARCLGITLSEQQFDFVRGEIARLGIGDRVEVRLVDYRELEGAEGFDKIASIGMVEHVGQANLPRYFAKIQSLLKPGGLVLNHGITAGSLDATGLRSGISRFIDEYVFPGGELVHIARMVESGARAGLECLDVESLRPHYARTLWNWVDRLDAHAERARSLVGESRFRIWRIYMSGSAHAFGRGWMSVHQLLAGKPRPDGSMSYPYTRDHLFAAAG